LSEDEAAAELARLLADSYDDPDLFNHAILGRPELTDYQREWSRALIDHHTVAIETGNMLGKSWWTGGTVVPWWMATRPGSLTVCTGPSQSLLGSVLWHNVRESIDNAPLMQLFRPQISTGIKTSPHSVELANGSRAIGLSTTSIERMSGQHNANLLLVVEEASGVSDDIWQALDSLGAYRTIAIGNPIRAEGGFASLCIQGEQDAMQGMHPSQAVRYFNVPSTASPHAELDRSPVGLASRTWLDSMRRKHGADSLWHRVHVLAQRPKLSHERLIPHDHLARATSEAAASFAAEARKLGQAGKRRISCDVGEGVGNARSVIVVRDDAGILELAADRFQGPAETARAMADAAHRWQVPPDRISYDGAGITGRKLGNALEGVGLVGCRPYFGSGSGGKRFTNLRTATAAALARRLDPDHYIARGTKQWQPFHIPTSPHLPALLEELGELKIQLRGAKSALEDKSDMAERLGRSPDFCDALTQSFREDAING
jgi:hypothetical protein